MSPSRGENAVEDATGEVGALTEQAPIEVEEEELPRPAPAPRLCGVCQKETGKYKCPQCSMPYCSVACNRVHKENHPPPEPAPAKQPPPAHETPAPAAAPARQEASDPYDILLEHSADFKRLFAKYPDLEAELGRIHRATLPPSTTTNNNGGAMAAFGRKGPQQQQQPWTRDQGLRRGAEALRRARTNPHETGDGVREYCELVVYLLSQRPGDFTRPVREEVSAEESKVVARLLAEEKG